MGDPDPPQHKSFAEVSKISDWHESVGDPDPTQHKSLAGVSKLSDWHESGGDPDPPHTNLSRGVGWYFHTGMRRWAIRTHPNTNLLRRCRNFSDWHESVDKVTSTSTIGTHPNTNLLRACVETFRLA